MPATLLLGNPFHCLGRTCPRHLRRAAHRSHRSIQVDANRRADPGGGCSGGATRDQVDQQWVLVGSVFMLWALGPWLIAFGRQTPLLLPAILLRYVPVVANARIPGVPWWSCTSLCQCWLQWAQPG